MGVWNVATPAGTDPKSQGDDRIREMKVAIQEALRGGEADGDEAIFPGANPGTAPIFRYRGKKGTTAQRPAAGENGLYFDTTRNVLQRDNGAAWEDVGTNIPAGSQTEWFQAASPIGWTKKTDHNGKLLRVTSGEGGGDGGTQDPGTVLSLAHTHTINAHTHTIASDGGHYHESVNLVSGAMNPGSSNFRTDTKGAHTHGGATGSAGGTTGSAAADLTLAYINVIICEKD